MKLPKIEWPADMPEEFRWPLRSESPVLETYETRAWGHLNQKLAVVGTRGTEVIETLGGPKAPVQERTMAQVKDEIKAFAEQHGRRPTSRDPGWQGCAHWLRVRGLSIATLCDKMGLPSLIEFNRDIGQIETHAKAYYKEHGVRPQSSSGPEWKRYNSWLTNRGDSLYKLCTRLGLPETYITTRSLPEVKRELVEYYRKHGKRPSQTTDAYWRRVDSWLVKQGLSLALLCDQFGFASRYTSKNAALRKEAIR